jgi:C4-dicarboxylate-specific signal transduction histidine kinase
VTVRAAPAAEPLPVAADRSMLRQVFINLCTDSAQAIAQTDRQRAGTVTLTAGCDAGRAVLEVAGDGPGVAPELRRRLFEPYVTSREPGAGMGLGLAISRKNLLDHGGDLELARTSAAGAVFRLLLPLAAGAGAEADTEP